MSFSQPLFFLQQHELPYRVCRCRCPRFLIFVLLILLLYPLDQTWLVFRLELNILRPRGPSLFPFAPWLAEPKRPPPLLLWPLGPKSLLPPLAARPSPLLLVPLAVRPSILPLPSPPRARRFWVDASVSAARSSQSRPRTTTVFLIKTVLRCALAAGSLRARVYL